MEAVSGAGRIFSFRMSENLNEAMQWFDSRLHGCFIAFWKENDSGFDWHG